MVLYCVLRDVRPKTLIWVFEHHVMSVDVPSLKEYPQNFKSHKEMLVFVHHICKSYDVSAIPQKLQQRHANPNNAANRSK